MSESEATNLIRLGRYVWVYSLLLFVGQTALIGMLCTLADDGCVLGAVVGRSAAAGTSLLFGLLAWQCLWCHLEGAAIGIWPAVHCLAACCFFLALACLDPLTLDDIMLAILRMAPEGRAPAY